MGVLSGRGGERGQGLVEYGLILLMMGIVCLVLLVVFGGQLAGILNVITSLA